MAILEVSHIEKHFGRTNVLKDVSFSMEEGTALAIIGSSGSGKTTLLRCLNFLERPNGGTITVNGETLFDASTAGMEKDADLRRKRLHFGMVFQSFNLFPQYTALQNVTLAEQLLAQERPDFKQNKKKILEEIDAHGRQLVDPSILVDRTIHRNFRIEHLLLFDDLVYHAVKYIYRSNNIFSKYYFLSYINFVIR
jgi:polar amino acid transport system ATP-binding protein